MPSKHQSADTSERMRCPKLQGRIGEDPARWLDWDFLQDSSRRDLVFSVIDGIDSLERIRAWRAVERRLTSDRYADEARNPLDQPRGRIMERLDKREEWLRLHGERADRLPHGPRRPCDCCDGDGLTADELRAEQSSEVASYQPTAVDTSETSPETEEVGLGAFATDGGEDQ